MSGGFLGTIGFVLILMLPVHTLVLLLGSAAWLLVSAYELREIRRGFARCRRLRVTADGGILLLDSSGDWQPGRLLPGSILLRRIGWLRVTDSKGLINVELLRGNCRESHDWRRFQVIWRHIGGTP